MGALGALNILSARPCLSGGSRLSEAALFLAAYGPYGMVLNFDGDASISINDAADLLDFNSSGQVSNGALVGPGAKLTYSAPSAKLTEQADGNLAFQAHNLCLWSENVTNASWVKIGGTVTAPSVDTIREASTTGNHRFNQAITSSFPGQWTVELKADGRDKLGLYVSSAAVHVGVDLTAGTIGAISSGFGTYATGATIEPLSDSWYRVSLPYSAVTAIDIYLFSAWTIGGAATSSYTGDINLGIKLRKSHVRRTPSMSDYIATTTAAVYDLPYVYSGGVRTGILPEPAATNLALRSNDLTNASWIKSNVTAALNATGPDGVANSASTLTPSKSSGFAYQTVTVTGATSAVYSVFLRSTSGNVATRISLNAAGANPNPQVLDVTVTPQWQRFTWLITVTSGTPFNIIIGNLAGAWAPLTPIEVWGAQVETGTVATSPIITYGSTVLRAADNISMATSLFPSMDAAGTLYAMATRIPESANSRIVQANNANSSEFTDINIAAPNVLGSLVDGVDVTGNPAVRSITAGVAFKAAVGFSNGSQGVYLNGSRVLDGSAAFSATFTVLQIGNSAGSSQQFNGYISRILALPRRMSNTELQAVTA